MLSERPGISIPLRYNLESDFASFFPTRITYFNSTKVQFGVSIRSKLRIKRRYFNSTKVQFGEKGKAEMSLRASNFNSTKVQFGDTFEVGDLIPFSISIPLRYNLEKIYEGCYPFVLGISIPLRYNLERSSSISREI